MAKYLIACGGMEPTPEMMEAGRAAFAAHPFSARGGTLQINACL